MYAGLFISGKIESLISGKITSCALGDIFIIPFATRTFKYFYIILFLL